MTRSGEHDDWPGRGNVQLCDQRLAMRFTFLLLLDATIGAVLARKDHVISVFRNQKITTTLAQGLAMGWSPILVFLLNLRKAGVIVYGS